MNHLRRSVHHRPAVGKERDSGADWTAWALHLGFGLLVGAAIGTYLAIRLDRFLSPFGDVLRMASGVSFMIAGVASHWGDRLWVRRSLFDPPEPRRSRRSAILSGLIAAVGVILLLTCFVGGHDPASSHGDTFRADKMAMVTLAIFLLGLGLYGWRTGTALTIHFRFHQEDSPFLYWACLILQFLAAFGLLLESFA